MKPKEEKDEPKYEVHIPKESIIKGEHEFDYISGTEVMCKKCPLGYVLTPGSQVKDGHIYIENKLLV
jgi:hypothetical protein